MATQTTKKVKRAWGGSDREALKQLVTAVQAIRFGEVSVNPASAAAGAEVGAVVALPEADFGTIAAGALVFVQPPAAFEAGLYVRRWWISAPNQLTVTVRNETAGAIDAAAANWTVLVLNPVNLSVL